MKPCYRYKAGPGCSKGRKRYPPDKSSAAKIDPNSMLYPVDSASHLLNNWSQVFLNQIVLAPRYYGLALLRTLTCGPETRSCNNGH